MPVRSVIHASLGVQRFRPLGKEGIDRLADRGVVES